MHQKSLTGLEPRMLELHGHVPFGYSDAPCAARLPICQFSNE